MEKQINFYLSNFLSLHYPSTSNCQSGKILSLKDDLFGFFRLFCRNAFLIRFKDYPDRTVHCLSVLPGI